MKNRIWTHSLVKLGANKAYQHVVAPIRLLREVTYFIADSQLVDLWMSRLTLLVTDNIINTYIY